MKKIKIIFTDSGLGGLTILASFAKLMECHGFSADLIYFNAQHSRNLGYKKMHPQKQVEVFDSALQSMQKKFKPDIIAIACNTLSVVYLKSKFYTQSKTKVLDIIETGKSLIKSTNSSAIIELAMPTTIESGLYFDKNKEIIGISTDTSLPDAIENGDYEKADKILEQAFNKAKTEIQKRSLNNVQFALFLGCTHFPVIKDKFIEIAEKIGIQINALLNPNAKFSQLIFEELQKLLGKTESDKKLNNSVIVVSRMRFKELELKNISNIVKKQSPETAKALINYEYDTKLF